MHSDRESLGLKDTFTITKSTALAKAIAQNIYICTPGISNNKKNISFVENYGIEVFERPFEDMLGDLKEHILNYFESFITTNNSSSSKKFLTCFIILLDC